MTQRCAIAQPGHLHDIQLINSSLRPGIRQAAGSTQTTEPEVSFVWQPAALSSELAA
jgi:hypothetical protein